MRKMPLLNAALVVICFYPTFSYGAEYWARIYNYGGDCAPSLRSIQQTSDEGYLVTGRSCNDMNTNPNFLKLDKSGNALWGENFDSIINFAHPSIQQTSDGGYIAAISDANAPSTPTYLLKLGSTGNILWQKAYEGILAEDIQLTYDGGYVVTGFGSLNPDTEFSTDFCVLKLDRDGNILWQKTYGSNKEEWPSYIQQTKDGGYIVAGAFIDFQNSSYANWVLKLDESGNIEWQRNYDFSFFTFFIIKQTADGGYITTGIKTSPMTSEAVILKLDKDGNILWQKAYGDNAIVYATYILQTSDGSYLVAGTTDKKAWLLKIAEGGNILWQRSYGDENSWLDSPSLLENKSGQYLMACTYQNTSGDGAVLLLKLDKNGIIPSCEIVQTNNIQVSNISIGWSNTTANPYATSIVPKNSNIVPVDSSPVVSTICFQDSLNANAGADQVVFASATLDGSGSYAENGQIINYTWELKHRENPAYNRTASGATPTITNLAKGFYDVTLTVEDETGATGQDSMLLSAAGSCESATTTTAPPTNIELSILDATPSDKQVILKWKTESEVDNAGFNVWRADNFVKINDAIIPALGSSVSGSEYDFVDEWVLNGKRYFYLLEDIDTNGISTFHGPVKTVPRWIYGIGK